MLTKDVLNLQFYSSELGKTVTVKEYFKAQLKALWTEQDGFSGKRPLGDSDWGSVFMDIFLYHKLIDGPEDYDAHDRIVAKCLEAL